MCGGGIAQASPGGIRDRAEELAGVQIAGDKAGDWKRWFKKNIPLADDLFDDHLTRLRGE